MRREVLVIWLLVAGAARAEDAPEKTPPPETPVVRLRSSEAPRLPTRERLLLAPGTEVDASDALDEMLDEFALDIARLGSARSSPILLERVRVSDNMNPDFAATLEARLASALARATGVGVMHCAECWATRGRVENGAWIVTRGVTQREELRELAARYGARSFLSVALTLHSAPDSMALDVELVRAEDSVIVFAEGYRIHPYNAMLYRGADTAQSREARLKDLEERIANRPQFGHGALLGIMAIPTDNPASPGMIVGPYGAYRLYEKFGKDRQNRFGLSVGGFLNTDQLAGAIIALGLWTQLTDTNVYAPSLHLGGSLGALVTGTAGNTPLVSLQAEYLFGSRLALQASLSYVLPFEFATKGYKVGGLSPQGGMAFLW